MLHDNDAFLSKLDRLYKGTHSNGTSVFLQFKSHDGRTKPRPRDPSKSPSNSKKAGRQSTPSTSKAGKTDGEQNLICLVRASAGSTKISTHVKAADSSKFHAALNTLVRANMYGLVRKASGGRVEKS